MVTEMRGPAEVCAHPGSLLRPFLGRRSLEDPAWILSYILIVKNIAVISTSVLRLSPFFSDLTRNRMLLLSITEFA